MVTFLGTGRRPIPGITMGASAVTFDRDVRIGGTILKKGVAYETGQPIFNYMLKFCEGCVLDPVCPTYPAAIEIPADGYAAGLINRGSRWGGYRIAAKKTGAADGNTASVTVDYDLTKIYLLDIDTADENVTNLRSTPKNFPRKCGKVSRTIQGNVVNLVTFISS